MIFDLDPSGDDFTPVRDAASTLGDLLRELGLEPYLMTTGSRGLHVTVPLDREADFDRVRAFARRIADHLAGLEPDRWTTEQRKNKRRGRLFLDTMRNAYAQTGVAPYALRARPGAPVATPLHWSELDAHLHPRKYHARNLFRRLAQKRDPWKDIDESARGLDRAEVRLEQMAPAEKAPSTG
jgi:bifunctional non-homologous end joining protein LigD